MGFKWNPLTGQLDLVNDAGSSQDALSAKTLILEKIASENISALKLVYLDTQSSVRLADNLSEATGTVIGIALNTVLIGGLVRVLVFGILEDAFFNYSINQRLFLGSNGEITTVQPISGVLTSVGFGLGSVDNTSDINKPISTATQVALNAKYDASNPNNYETPTQLNARDTANRSRSNHSGTQLASTISDFSSATLGVLLAGISFLTNSAILATDSMLIAFGKIQAQLNDHFGSGGTAHALATTIADGFMSALDKIKLDGIVSDVILFMTSALTNTSNATFVTIPELQIPVVSGKRYKFEAYLLFDSNATGTGIGLSMGGTASGTLRAIAQAPVSNTAGTGNNFGGPINAINGVVTTSGVGATGTQYRAQIEGVFTATSNGFIYPQFRSENNGTQVRVNIDSNIVYKEF